MNQNPNDPSDIAGTGAAIGGALAQIGTIFQDRYNRKQYDDFLAGPSKEYQSAMQQAQDLMLDEDNADAPQQAVHIIKNATTDFMDNATRFKNNPYIMEKATRVWEGHMNFLKDEFTAKFEAAKIERENAAAANEAEMGPLKKQELESKIDLNKANAEKARRPAAPTAADARGLVSYMSGDPAKLAEIQDPDKRISAARTNILSQILSPRDEQQRDQINLGIQDERRSLAMQQVSDRAARGESRPQWTDSKGTVHGGKTWNPASQEDVADAMAKIDPAIAQEAFILRTIQGEASSTGIDADAASRKLGAFVDPGRATPQNPVTRPLNDEEMGKVLFGGSVAGRDSATWSSLRVPDIRGGKPVVDKDGNPVMRAATTLKEAAAALPDSYEKLNGILGDSVDSVVRILGAEAVAGRKLTRKDVVEAIKESGVTNVAALLGGSNTSTGDLPSGVRRNRGEAKMMIDAMAEKYADEVMAKIFPDAAPAKPVAKSEEKPANPNVILGGRALRDFTPLGTAGKRIDQITGLFKGKE
jgi:hypothetical protein